MSTTSTSRSLLNRTKFAQSKTRFVEAKCTLLSSLERPRFLVEPFEASQAQRKQLAIRKAFLNRKKSRQGPFGKLNPPHAYVHAFGDPSFMNLEQVTSTCTAASDANLSDHEFWRQICEFGEKIRTVRDLLDVVQLMQCLESITKVNHYDPDLLRMLSREFVDDMHKLTVPHLARVLEAYRINNVHSIDLVTAAVKRVTSELDLLVQNEWQALKEDAEGKGWFSGGKKGKNPANLSSLKVATIASLGTLLRCLDHFGHKDVNFWIMAEHVFTRCRACMQPYNQCVAFCTISTQLMGSTQEHADVTSALLELMEALEGFSVKLQPGSLDACASEYRIHAILKGFKSEDVEHTTRILDSCAQLKVISRLLQTAASVVDFLGGVHAKNGVDYDSGKATSAVDQLVLTLERLVNNTREFVANVNVTQGPYMDAVRYLVTESMVKSLVALYKTWTLEKQGSKVSEPPLLLHSSELKGLNMVKVALESILELKCSGQDLEDLIQVFNAICISSQESVQSQVQRHDINAELIQACHDLVALEICKRFISLRPTLVGSIVHALHNFGLHKNTMLRHCLKTFKRRV